MFENILNFFKKFSKDNNNKDSKDTAKERLHLVLMQDRANVSADFLEMMKQEIIEVIKKYIDVDENSIDVKLTNKVNADGTTGAPALYANIPIVSLKDETKNINIERNVEDKIKTETKSKDESNKKEIEENKKEKIEETNITDEKEEIDENKNDSQIDIEEKEDNKVEIEENEVKENFEVQTEIENKEENDEIKSENEEDNKDEN